MFRRLTGAVWAPWAGVALAAACAWAVAARVDLTPRVEGEFFFADDDPQLTASREVRERFRMGEQVILRVGDPGAGPDDPARDREAYRTGVAELRAALGALEGVETVWSVVDQDADDPLWSRLLLTPDPAATNVVVSLADGVDAEALVPRLEAAAGAVQGLDVVMSGAPVIVEWIRRHLLRDLVVFTGGALILFTLLVAGVYRDGRVLAGMLATSVVSVCATLLVSDAWGVHIGLLTANLATIVFVLTLSHMVFITANVRRARADGDGATPAEAAARGVARTLEGSFWGMATTLLGFLSLLVATARPLRELGTAGAVGAVLALVAAYVVYPAFLGRGSGGSGDSDEARAPGGLGEGPAGGAGPGSGTGRRRGWAAAGVVAGVGLLAVGVPRLDTDPGLLTYFAADSDLRQGLERIDGDGGSSPLHMVVRLPDGGGLDTDAAYDALARAQEALEADPRTGVVLGPSVLMDQARTFPLARFLPLSVLLDIASSPRLDEVALGFVTADRGQGLFTIRMRESAPRALDGGAGSREAVMNELAAAVVEAGLEPVQVAGLYELQGRLGELIRESLAVGVGGLWLLFLLVAAVVARSGGLTLRMWLCLGTIPLVVLGTFGWLGIAVDIITSPAANVALAVGVDAMIHLVVRVRRFRAVGVADPWGEALARVRPPVLAATGILAAGFGLFVLSSFPPTRRFGLAVILGTVTAAVLALVVLPRWAGRRPSAPQIAPDGATARP